MLKEVSKLIFKVNGWTYENQVGQFGPKCILVAAPHTSNWDYNHGLVFFEQMGIPAKIAMKKELFVFPIKQFIEPLGALAIDRTHKDGMKKSSVEAMADLFKEHDELILVITPEGTRSKTDQWKTGFYHVARLANVPIVLSYLDYKERKGVVGKIMYASDDMEQDMRTIMAFYKEHGVGKYPENFALDKRYI
ncbi:MAG: 1-acyl-sn-glycerol-3-phosphate acyltransferase [Chitinophagales bacterium]